MKTIYTDNSKLLEILVANGINIICNDQMEKVVSDTDAIKIDAIVAAFCPLVLFPAITVDHSVDKNFFSHMHKI